MTLSGMFPKISSRKIFRQTISGLMSLSKIVSLPEYVGGRAFTVLNTWRKSPDATNEPSGGRNQELKISWRTNKSQGKIFLLVLLVVGQVYYIGSRCISPSATFKH